MNLSHSEISFYWSWRDHRGFDVVIQAISRRKFVTTSALAVGAATIGFGLVYRGNSHRGAIRLLPVEGVAYTESFTRFMNRAKFDSVRDAIASIRDRSVPVRVVHIKANVPIGPGSPGPTDTKVCQTRRTDSHRAAGNLSVGAISPRPLPSAASLPKTPLF